MLPTDLPPRQAHILAIIELGYPEMKFSKHVEAKSMSIHWRGRKQNG